MSNAAVFSPDVQMSRGVRPPRRTNLDTLHTTNAKEWKHLVQAVRKLVMQVINCCRTVVSVTGCEHKESAENFEGQSHGRW
jgi:hypothetical protein